jgi:hypothetical protein
MFIGEVFEVCRVAIRYKIGGMDKENVLRLIMS